MKHYIDADGNLVIKTQGHERRTLRMLAKKNTDFHSNGFLYELLESLIANSDYYYIRPEEIGALTDATILGTRDNCGKVIDAWAFMDYQIRSVQQDLMEYGKAIFQG